ncbi:DUF2388 domain-containing protein [Pseudomonas oryzihabitans]|uniref:DUF2388 domain-containing protein n=1 Tax=Pseudomonas oryzihabitans TaxID=47885 RepID=UPI00073642A8|nr:DUF2388 domain-containing protein [Pseudomonas psychrotolerans]KTT47948.1 holliday junction resolvasome, helicase subunit [Pseudomonas psychrotolerans]MDR6676962.1 uncharacterized protein (TIGR02448 family) [Pseudomonas psychrotolerans]QDD90626.1 holliday junction resolvasome, helicase subunit [Pseudomonas psychrotolerans]
MKTLHLGAAAALFCLSSAASASSFYVTTDIIVNAIDATSDATSAITGSFKNDKLVLEARDDAASFVGSAGDIRGVRLEAALDHLRTQAPQLRQASDAQLAQAILAI